MAHNLRYYNEFTSRHYKRLVRVEILERDYAGVTEHIRMGATINLSDSGDGREVPIKKLTASLRLLSTKNFQFEHLFTSDDKKYLVKIFRGGTNVFTGFLESDSYSEPYYSWKDYTVNLTARDNLGRLEDIPYLLPNGDRAIGLEKASAILLRVLEYTGYFLNLFDFIDIWSSDMNESNIVTDQTYNNNDAFWNFEDDEPFSCLDVLTNILTGFGAQIRQVNNNWVMVEQSNYYNRPTIQGNSASFPSYLAPKLNFPLVTKAFKWINRDAEMTILPAWKEFTLNQDALVPDSFFNKFPLGAVDYTFVGPEGNRYTLNNWNMNGFNVNYREGFTNAFIDPIGAAGWNIDVETPVKQTNLNLLIQLDYRNGSSFFYGTPVTESPVIDVIISDGAQTQILTNTGWAVFTGQSKELRFDNIVLNSNSSTEVSVVSNGIPFDGDLKIVLHYETAQVFSVSDITYSFRDAKLIYSLNSIINQNNNLTPDDFELSIGQVPDEQNSVITYFGGLFTALGVAQVDWKRDGDATAETLLKKVAIGYDLQNRQPARQVNGTVIWDWDFWTNIDDQDKRLMINSGSWNMNTDEMNAEFVEVFEYKNTSGGFDNGFNEGFDNQIGSDYQTDTNFTLTQKTE